MAQEDGNKLDTKQVIENLKGKLDEFNAKGERLAQSIKEVDEGIIELSRKLDAFLRHDPSQLTPLSEDDRWRLQDISRTITTGTTVQDGGGKTSTTKPSVKYCARCHTKKPLGEFSPSNQSKDGLSSYCKPCKSEIERDRYKSKRHKAPSSVSPPKSESVSEPGPSNKLLETASTPTKNPAAVVSKILKKDFGLKDGFTTDQVIDAVDKANKKMGEEKPPVEWTRGQDKTLRDCFKTMTISEIYLQNKLPKEYSMTDIKQRCIHLKLMDPFGNKYTPSKQRKDEQPPDLGEEDQ